MHTFYLKPESWQAPFLLEGQEAKHLAQVLRLKVGDEVALFDGQGRQGCFVVEKAGKNQVQLRQLSETLHPRPPAAPVLALAFTKALRRSWIMEKAVEFQAGEIWIWQAERSQGKVAATDANSASDVLEHWEKQLLAGAKQCGNLWLPRLRLINGGATGVVAALLNDSHLPCLLWEKQDSSAPGAVLSLNDLCPDLGLDTPAQNLPTRPTPKTPVFIIGPEGGISAAEAETFIQAGALCRSLGNTILRYETAALLCLGLSWWARQSLGGNK